MVPQRKAVIFCVFKTEKNLKEKEKKDSFNLDNRSFGKINSGIMH